VVRARARLTLGEIKQEDLDALKQALENLEFDDLVRALLCRQYNQDLRARILLLS
jgi:hypothetical protein